MQGVLDIIFLYFDASHSKVILPSFENDQVLVTGEI
jgi:hypothetical protein